MAVIHTTTLVLLYCNNLDRILIENVPRFELSVLCNLIVLCNLDQGLLFCVDIFTVSFCSNNKQNLLSLSKIELFFSSEYVHYIICIYIYAQNMYTVLFLCKYVFQADQMAPRFIQAQERLLLSHN